MSDAEDQDVDIVVDDDDDDDVDYPEPEDLALDPPPSEEGDDTVHAETAGGVS
jgi:hypothetical protein